MSRLICPYTKGDIGDFVCVDEFGDKKEIANDCPNCPYYNGGIRT